MDDIEYELTDWITGKTSPERVGKYEVEIDTGHKYQAVWNGEYWHNDWNDEKIKVKQWRGIAYDPDTHVFKDEPFAES